MKINIFDIETRPKGEKLIKSLSPEFKREEVKTGNYGPEKAEEKILKAEQTHWTNIYSKATLDPALSEICAIGVSVQGTNETQIFRGKEKDILRQFWELFDALRNDLWGFYSGNNKKEFFDVRHITHRSWANHVKMPIKTFSRTGYMSDQFIDIANVYLAGAPHPTYVSANLAAQQLGLIGSINEVGVVQSKKTIEKELGVTGANFWEVLDENEQKALVYLNNDLAIERGIAEVVL